MLLKTSIALGLKGRNMTRHVSDHWRSDLSCYASQWGFRCGSEIATLMDFIRDKYRAKYGFDYRLRRIGKNRYLVVPGDTSSYGVSFAIEASKEFDTTVTNANPKGINEKQTDQTCPCKQRDHPPR